MKSKVKMNRQLRTYFQWPVYMLIVLVAMNIWAYTVNISIGAIYTVIILIYALGVFAMYFKSRPFIEHELISFATEYAQAQKKLVDEFKIPYALLDTSGNILWMNKEFSALSGKDRKYRKSINTIFQDIDMPEISIMNDNISINQKFEDKELRLEFQKISISALKVNPREYKDVDMKQYMIAIYVFDETELRAYIKKTEDEKLVAGLVYIDNYEEALESVEEVRRSLLGALIDRKINKFFGSYDGIVKKIEKDKYFIAFKNKYLAEIEKGRFSILEDVKGVNIGNEMAITLSIGIGVQGDGYNTNYETARTAIDLALGRGGDQAVVKKGEKISYYGGKSKQVEKSTRVKARVKAHALREILEGNDKVVIMGHQMGDVDSFGASIGIYRVAKALNKKAFIVINQVTTTVRPIMNRFKDNPDYDKTMFLSSNEVFDYVDNSTVVVVVDVNRPSYTECKELLTRCKNIVVLDHHRQGSEVIENAVLSYIEPYASSACEMVAEILQYIQDGLKIKPIEADAMYAGMLIDTNNFMNKTGVRTFEAAAFLKRSGADITRVRKLLRDDMSSYRAKAKAASNSELFMDSYAISVCYGDGVESPTVVGAQVANELLDIDGIKASFVVTEYNGKLYISARSIDEVNVQIIMERLGGGGHMTIAGAQIEGMKPDEGVDIIKQTISDMIKEGAI